MAGMSSGKKVQMKPSADPHDDRIFPRCKLPKCHRECLNGEPKSGLSASEFTEFIQAVSKVLTPHVHFVEDKT